MKLILSLMIPMLLCVAGIAQTAKQSPSSGQRPPNGQRLSMEQIDALKIAFITDKLDLTTAEAQNFWPVYNRYQAEINNLQAQKRGNLRANNKTNPEAALTTDLYFERKLLDTKVKYAKSFMVVISAQKILELYKAEIDFRDSLIRELHKRSDDDKKDSNKK